MKKLLTISSINQNSENFTVSLPEEIRIPPNHEIALLNMSLDTQTASNYHYSIPASFYELDSQTATLVLNEYDFDSTVFFFSNVPQTLNLSDYTGVHGHDYEITLFNGGIRWIRMTTQTTFDYYVVETDPPTLTGTFDPTASPQRFTFSSGTVWELLTPNSGVPLKTGKTLTFSEYAGVNNHSWLASADDGTSFYLTKTSFTHHATDGAVSVLTGIIDDGVSPHTLTLSNGEVFEAAADWTLNTPPVTNHQFPRAEFLLCVDNLPISNHIANDTVQKKLPIIYSHHNRFDNERDEIIEPKHLIYHKLENNNVIVVNRITITIRDNIDGNILHDSTLNISTNLTLHIRPVR